VGVVHGLERNAGVIAVEVAVLHEVLDGIDDLYGLSVGASLRYKGHDISYLLQQLCLLEACFQHCPGVSDVSFSPVFGRHVLLVDYVVVCVVLRF
jgi:hypothetical protein